MSHPRSGAIRQPANDLAAFDISRQSADDIARLFGRWKEQRKHLQSKGPPARAPRSTRFMPVVVGDTDPTDVAPAPVTAEPPGAVRYSAPFADLLATREKEVVAQKIRAFALEPAKRHELRATTRQARLRWVLAGAASLLAVAAASATVLWQSSMPQQPGLAQAQSAPAAHSGTAGSHLTPAPVEIVDAPVELQPAARFLPMAVQPPHERAAWQLALEIALLQPTPIETAVAQAHLSPILKPKIAAQTASKPAKTSTPVTQHEPAPQMVIWTKARSADEEVSVAIPPETVPVAKAVPEKRPDAFYQRGNDKAVSVSGQAGHASTPANKSRADNGSGKPGAGGASGSGGDPGEGGSPGNGGSPGSGGPGGSPGSGSGAGDAGDSGSDAGSGDNTGGQSGDTEGSGESGSDSGSSSGDQSGDSQGDDGSGSSKPDKPHKGADVDAHVGVGGGGIGASVGGHVGGIGGGLGGGIGH